MASPLRKRFPRELKDNLGKYLGIFLLMSVTIAQTSGFLLAAHSIGVIIDDMPEKYSIEDARFTTAFEATDEQLDAAADVFGLPAEMRADLFAGEHACGGQGEGYDSRENGERHRGAARAFYREADGERVERCRE